jgi:hypothetical protein
MFHNRAVQVSAQEPVLREMRRNLRYWAFLAVKLVAATIVAALVLRVLNYFWLPATPWFHLNRAQFGRDLGYSTLVMVWFLFSYGLFYLAVWDQRSRCRTCLRRLVMPVESGSWSSMLQFGRPQLEYICAWGHGRLNVEELEFPGKVDPEWTEQGDMWAELYAAADADKLDGDKGKRDGGSRR